jgi:hypothetical protein
MKHKACARKACVAFGVDFNAMPLTEAVLLDPLAGAAEAGAVAVSGAAIALTGRLFWLDPTLAVAIAVVIAVPRARNAVRPLPQYAARQSISRMTRVEDVVEFRHG